MEDWQPGDLALCVGRHRHYPECVRPGAIFTVAYVWPGSVDADNPEHFSTALDFIEVDRMPGDIAYWHRNFHKIAPHTPDAEDEFTISLIKGHDLVAMSDRHFIGGYPHHRSARWVSPCFPGERALFTSFAPCPDRIANPVRSAGGETLHDPRRKLTNTDRAAVSEILSHASEVGHD